MKTSQKFKRTVEKLTNFSNNPIISAPLDALSSVFPAKSAAEDETRNADRKKALAGDLGERIRTEPALVGGHLNRDKILIGTSVFYSDKHFTQADIKRISDGGFDFIVTVDDGDFREKILDECAKHNIAVIAKDSSLPIGPEIRNIDLADDTLFAAYRKHPAQVGDMGWDEANARDFYYIGNFYERYIEALPEQFLFNNLFPAGATKKMLGTKSYKSYVDSFSAQVDSDYISTDIYPFHPLAVINKFTMSICLHTYHCVGNTCRRDGRDFWLYLQTQGRWFSHIYALPTYEQIKWQMYAALCYGARSLIHVAYTPVWDNDAYAMLDRQGNLTEQYIYAKRINAEIQQLSGVIKNYRSLGVLPVKAKKENPHFVFASAKQKKDSAEQGFSGISPVKSITGESSALVGYFKNPSSGAYALLLVNCNNLYDSAATQKLRVAFASPVSVKVYAHGKLKMSCTVPKGLEITIGSCDGVFVEIESK